MAPFEGGATRSRPGRPRGVRADRPTLHEQTRVLAWCAAVMRVAIGTAVAAAAVLYPPSGHLWPVAAAVSLCWAAAFAVLAVRHGLTVPLVTCEIALTCLACLHQGDLLPPGALAGGVSWVASLVTMSIVVTNMAWSADRAVPACALLVLCHLLGSRHAGATDGGTGAAGIQTLQVGVLATMTCLVRRVADLADGVLADLRARQRRAAEDGTRRREEQRRADELHGTVLATLTAVAGGGVRSHDRLRRHAERAVSVLEALDPQAPRPDPAAVPGPAGPLGTGPFGTGAFGTGPFGAGPRGSAPQDTGPQDPAVRLDIAVRYVVAGVDLTVRTDLEEVLVPGDVAETVVIAVEELLTNVRRHARTGAARLTLTRTDRGFELEVRDDGAGFDTAGVSPQRYGLRHAVRDAVRAAGGTSDVRSAPGRGTRVLLRWPR